MMSVLRGHAQIVRMVAQAVLAVKVVRGEGAPISGDVCSRAPLRNLTGEIWTLVPPLEGTEGHTSRDSSSRRQTPAQPHCRPLLQLLTSLSVRLSPLQAFCTCSLSANCQDKPFARGLCRKSGKSVCCTDQRLSRRMRIDTHLGRVCVTDLGRDLCFQNHPKYNLRHNNNIIMMYTTKAQSLPSFYY